MKEHDIDYSYKGVRTGQIVKGEVIKVTDRTIYIDLHDFTEGRMHLDNYTTEALDSFRGIVNVGDIIEAKVQKINYDEPSMILLSRLPLLREQAFDDVIKQKDEANIVRVKIIRAKDKGFDAKYNSYDVFIPYSLVEYEMKDDAKSHIGKELEVVLIEAERRGRFTNVIATRKPIFQKERQEAIDKKNKERQDELDAIKTGDVLEGTVEKIEKNAAVIRFNHIIGLLRISQVSHHRIETVSEVLCEGEKVTVKVIKKEGNRLDLSIKALQKTPYEIYSESNKVGDKVSGKVVQKLPFGIVLELDKDVRGLLHKSEFSWNPNDNFDSYVKIGDQVELSIISIDPKKERISLSKKSLEDNPWKNVNVKKGDVVKAVIKEIDKNGLIVEVQGVNALIPNNELSNERIGKVEDYFAVNDTVEAIITDFDKGTWTMALSIKKLQNQSERENFEKYLQEENDDSKVTIGDIIEEEDIK